MDQYNALKGYSDLLSRLDDGEFEKMKDSDKDWMTVKYGFFILLTNIDSTPEDILTRYFGRTNIEVVFKTSKEYLDLLPLSKWTDKTVRGKILSDIINTIVLLLLRKKMGGSGLSASELYDKSQWRIHTLDIKTTVSMWFETTVCTSSPVLARLNDSLIVHP